VDNVRQCQPISLVIQWLLRHSGEFRVRAEAWQKGGG
jgi:hypothetical protein